MTAIILGLETATDACSVALSTPDKTYTEYAIEPQAHSKLLIGMVDSVCKQAGIDLSQVQAVAFGQGPGSFTGLRIAASVAQGLAYGVGKPVIAISSLQALAQQAYNQSRVANIIAILDARMQEIYWGGYQVNAVGLVEPVLTDCLQKPGNLKLDPVIDYLLVGTGAKAYAPLILANNPSLKLDLNILYPRAEEIVQLAIGRYSRGETLQPSQAVPAYIRNNVTQAGKKNPD